MGQRIARFALAAAVAAAAIFSPFFVEACGPFFFPPVFTQANAPDVPLALYAKGKLDLLEPGFFRVYLFVAYRNLDAQPLSDAEIRSLSTMEPGGPSVPPAEHGAANPAPVNWIDRWKQARKQVLGDSATVNFGYYDGSGISRFDRKGGLYFGYENCLSGAFENATLTLDRRVAQFGAASPGVKQWLAAQDDVFANCSGGLGVYPPRPPAPTIPAAALAGDPTWLREDRAYQIAAAHFYAGDLQQAQAEFSAIAHDPSSPYRNLAPYLVARCLIRQATMTAGPGRFDAPVLEQAARQLRQILADPQQSEFHQSAQGLLAWIGIRLDPSGREKELESALSGAKPDPEFHQDLVDYLWLLDRSEGRAAPPPAPGSSASAAATPAGGDGGPTDWIFTFSGRRPEPFEHAYETWSRTHRLPWLVAAISLAQGNDPAAPRLVAAAADVPPHSPAYATVTFHRLRLLAEMGEAADARHGLDRVLTNPAVGLSLDARNEFLALRTSLSRSLPEWLRYAARQATDVSGYGSPVSPSIPPKLFDADAATTLTEQLPLNELALAAQSAELPPTLRQEIAIAAWTRAILLGDRPAARRLTPVLASLAPALRPSLAAYARARSSPEKDFAATLLLLHFPGMRPFVPAGLPRSPLYAPGPEPLASLDEFRDNWWCTLGQPKSNTWNFDYYKLYSGLSPALRIIYPAGVVPSPAFLTPPERAVAAREWAALQQLPTAPDWMAQQALAWAKAHPSDPRVPEALHLVVRATRFGCTDAATGEYSKRAFLLLHRRYPASPWTKKTPFWFNPN